MSDNIICAYKRVDPTHRMYVNIIYIFNILVDNNMSYKLLAIYFATSYFRQKTHSLQSVNEENPTYKRVKRVSRPV